jgi:hypothetical protein
MSTRLEVGRLDTLTSIDLSYLFDTETKEPLQFKSSVEAMNLQGAHGWQFLALTSFAGENYSSYKYLFVLRLK